MIYSKAETEKKRVAKYPCLMIDDYGKVVLFDRVNSGTVLVQSNASQPIGFRSATWHMPYFKPFDGVVTLSSDKLD